MFYGKKVYFSLEVPEMSICFFEPADEPDLVSLWQTGFSDDAAFIRDLLHNIVHPGRNAVPFIYIDR